MKALLTAIGLLAPGFPSQEPQDADPVVLHIGEDTVRRRAFEDWMLRTYGERRANGFAEVSILRQRFGTKPLENYREQVLEEFQVRIDNAFNGDRSKFVKELESFGRSFEGRLAERSLELEYAELSARVQSLYDFRTELQVELGTALLPAGYTAPLTDDLELFKARWRDVALAVRRADFTAWMRGMHGEKVVARFVEAYTVRRAARAKKITATEQEVRERVERSLRAEIEALFGGDRDRWLKDLNKNGREESEYRREHIIRARVDLLAEKLVLAEREVTPEEIAHAWEEEYGKDGIRHEFRWLRIDPEPARSKEDKAEALEAAREEALRLRERIDNGEDFATLCEKHSDDQVTRPNGGVPIATFRIHHLAEALQGPVLKLAPGELSDALVHTDGVYVFEMMRVRKTPLEKVEKELREKLKKRVPSEVEIARMKNDLTRGVEVRVEPALFR